MSRGNKGSIIRLNASESEQACREITATLPEWFGIPEANERYAAGVKERLSFGYLIDENCLGMLCLEVPFPQTAHIYWMGVKRDSHHQGIGRALLRYAEQFCLEQHIYSLTVETLSPKQEDPSYLNTFKFYISRGFQPLFELQPYGPDHLMIYLNKILSPKIFQWIDLTHELSETIPTWNGSCGFQHTTILKYEECSPDCQFLVQRIEMLAGSGTHIDAPAHCFPNGNSVSEIPLNSLISPCVVVDVSKEAHELYSIEMPVIEKFEKEHGKICPGTFVIFYTGWERFWNQPEKYHHHHRFPCVAKQVADYLIAQDIVGIGIDTLSPDRGDEGFPVHQVILGAGKYIVENLAHANQMPTTGGYVFVMPLRIAQGTEAPIRLLGMISGHATDTDEVRVLCDSQVSQDHLDPAYQICYKETASVDEEAVLIEGLMQEAFEAKGMSKIQSYSFFIKNSQEKVLGGLKGASYYGCLYIDTLWISPSLRNQGWGTKLMKEAEELGRARHCSFASLTTMDWEAFPFYQKLDYEIEYIREGFENESKMFVLRKTL